MRGRSLPYGESTGYGALATMIRSVADIFETDPPRQAEEKLRRRVEALIDVGNPRTVLAHLSLLAGITEDAVNERSELFTSAREFFEALGRERATLFVFEDIHWANPSLLDLIESVAAHVREVPAMFLTLARGELLDARPSWGGGIPRQTGVSLEPLAADDAHELALRSLRGVPEAEAAAERIEQAAGGNPLFVEELTAAMAEGAADAAQGLPVAIRATISARLDALPAQERRLLLDASVVGNTFWRGAVERLAGDERSVVPALEDLEFRELIRRRRVSRMQGDEEFSFKHELIRDVAYGRSRGRPAVSATRSWPGSWRRRPAPEPTRRRYSPTTGARPATRNGPSAICYRRPSWRAAAGPRGRRWRSTTRRSSCFPRMTRAGGGRLS